jgi:hypothetical protein
MKKLKLLIVFCVVAQLVHAQKIQSIPAFGFSWNRGVFSVFLTLPARADTVFSSTDRSFLSNGSAFFNTTDSSIYVFFNNRWRAYQSGSGGGADGNNYPTSISFSGGTFSLLRNGLSTITTTINTSNVTEGTNLYFTTARARSSLSQGYGIVYNTSTGVIDADTTALFNAFNILSWDNTYDSTFWYKAAFKEARAKSIRVQGTSGDIVDTKVLTDSTISHTLSLANTAVTPGTYGDATNIPRIIVDAKGRITGISTQAASGGMTNPLTTNGDMIYGVGSTPTRFAAGTSTQLLHSGAVPSWSAVNLTNDVTGTLQIGSGGTGQASANAALNAFLPAQTSNANKVLKTDATNTSWSFVDLVNSITGTLPIGNGGTNATTAAAAINNLLPTQASQGSKILRTDGTNVSWTTDATGIVGGIFDTVNNTIYAGVLRPTSDGIAGHDIDWFWLTPVDGHQRYGFADHIEATSSGFKLSFPTASKVLTVIVSDDESMASSLMMIGPSVGLDYVQTDTYLMNGVQGGYFTGNGSGGLTKSSRISTWDIPYGPSTGAISLNMQSGLPSPNYEAAQLVYNGPNNWHIKPVTSGLGIYNVGWQVLDAFNNPVTDNFATTDRFYITIGSTPSRTSAVSQTRSSAQPQYDGSFANYWVIAVVTRDTTCPQTVTGITETHGTTTVNLDWNDDSHATNYKVERSIHHNYGFSQVYSGATSAFNDTGLTTATTYYYRIKAEKTSGGSNSGWWQKSVTTN